MIKRITQQIELQLSAALLLAHLGSSQPPLDPRPHQVEAINANVAALSKPGSDVRATCVMACGTGKTLVAVRSAEEVSNRILLVEPSLALIRQTLAVWRANTKFRDLDVLVVCSDDSVTQVNGDEVNIKPEDIPGRVTSNPAEIAAFLLDDSRPKLLVTTLHSTPIVSSAMAYPGVNAFGCAVVDEAHRTTGKMDSDFALVLNQAALPARSRLFLTATPKVYLANGDNEETILSMDDPEVYGTRSYTLGFRRAIERGLLTDYRLIVTALPEAEYAKMRADFTSDTAFKDALSFIGFCRAAKQYGFDKTMTFHSTVARAEAFSNGLSEAWNSFGDGRALWASSVNGKMPTSQREGIISLFADKTPQDMAVLTNCRCLGEGVDIPALNCVAFIDRKSSEVDIVQAIGRVMRLPPSRTISKPIGNIFIPLVVPEGGDLETTLSSPEFGKVVQVIRALRAMDEGFQVHVKGPSSSYGGTATNNDGVGSSGGINIDFASLPANLQQSLTAKIISLSYGISGTLLTLEAIQAAAKKFRDEHGKWPSGHSKEPVPDMPNETWSRIDGAAHKNHRGLQGAKSLATIIAPLRAEYKELGRISKALLTVDDIQAAAKKFREAYGKWPSQHSKEPVPDMPNETWSRIDGAARNNLRGLQGAKSLATIIAPLRAEYKEPGQISKAFLKVDDIQAAAKKFRETYGEWPSGDSKEPVPDMPNETWGRIDGAARNNLRGLQGAKSLATIIAPLRAEYKEPGQNSKVLLSVDAIQGAAKKFREAHGKWPSQLSKEPVPDMPNETWGRIDGAARNNQRGLQGAKSLATIIAPLRAEYKEPGQNSKALLTVDDIQAAAKKFRETYGEWPSGDSKEPVPDMPNETWCGIQKAAYHNYRGLNGAISLSNILAPLKEQ
jgi:superfamily II DNA or RNA helicase